jgi:hypothetical protein
MLCNKLINKFHLYLNNMAMSFREERISWKQSSYTYKLNVDAAHQRRRRQMM